MRMSTLGSVGRATVALGMVAFAAACSGGIASSARVASTASPPASRLPSSAAASAEPQSASPAAPSVTASASIPQLGILKVARSIKAPGFGPIALGAGSAWAVDNTDNGFTDGLPNGDVYQIPLARPGEVTKIAHAQGGFPTVGEGALWLVNAEFGETVTRVDVKRRTVTRFRTSTTDEPIPEAVVTTPGAVWVGHNGDGTVAVIDPDSLTVTTTIRLAPQGVGGVRGWATTDGTSVWFPNTHTREIVRIDVASRAIVSRMELPLVAHPDRPPDVDLPDDVVSGAEGLLVVGDRLYASSASHVYVIDVSEPGSERIVADIPTEGFWAVRLAKAEDGTVWGLQGDAGALIKIDTASERIVGQVTIPARPQADAPHPSLGLFRNRVLLRYPGEVVELTLP